MRESILTLHLRVSGEATRAFTTTSTHETFLQIFREFVRPILSLLIIDLAVWPLSHPLLVRKWLTNNTDAFKHGYKGLHMSSDKSRVLNDKRYKKNSQHLALWKRVSVIHAIICS